MAKDSFRTPFKPIKQLIKLATSIWEKEYSQIGDTGSLSKEPSSRAGLCCSECVFCEAAIHRLG